MFWIFKSICTLVETLELMEKTKKFKEQKIVIIKEQPVKGGGIGCSDKNETSNVIYEF